MQLTYGKLNLKPPPIFGQTSRPGEDFTIHTRRTFGAVTPRVFGPWRVTTAPGLSLDEIRPKSLRTGG